MVDASGQMDAPALDRFATIAANITNCVAKSLSHRNHAQHGIVHAMCIKSQTCEFFLNLIGYGLWTTVVISFALQAVTEQVDKVIPTITALEAPLADDLAVGVTVGKYLRVFLAQSSIPFRTQLLLPS